MKKLKLLLAGTLLAVLAIQPAAWADEDEIEVTMQVIDDLDDLDSDFVEMRGPYEEADDEDGEAGRAAAEDDGYAIDEQQFEGIEDDFEHDDADDEMESDIDDEDDFEEDETVDDDDIDDIDDIDEEDDVTIGDEVL